MELKTEVAYHQLDSSHHVLDRHKSKASRYVRFRCRYSDPLNEPWHTLVTDNFGDTVSTLVTLPFDSRSGDVDGTYPR